MTLVLIQWKRLEPLMIDISTVTVKHLLGDFDISTVHRAEDTEQPPPFIRVVVK